MIQMSIIIVNCNTGELLNNCLKSIYATKTNFKYEIIVVDNNSDDDSIKIVVNKYNMVKFFYEQDLQIPVFKRANKTLQDNW